MGNKPAITAGQLNKLTGAIIDSGATGDSAQRFVESGLARALFDPKASFRNKAAVRKALGLPAEETAESGHTLNEFPFTVNYGEYLQYAVDRGDYRWRAINMNTPTKWCAKYGPALEGEVPLIGRMIPAIARGKDRCPPNQANSHWWPARLIELAGFGAAYKDLPGDGSIYATGTIRSGFLGDRIARIRRIPGEGRIIEPARIKSVWDEKDLLLEVRRA